MAAADAPALQIVQSRPGRAVRVQSDGTFYICHHYGIYRSDDEGMTWVPVTRMPRSFVRQWSESSRLACRLLRHEIRALAFLSDGTCVAANRQGIFYAEPGETVMTPSRIHHHGLAFRPPMNMAVGPGDRVVVGEYWGNKSRRIVRLFASQDGGRSFDVAHVFPAGQVKHVHNIVYDAPRNLYWVFVGDHGEEPGIGQLSLDFKDFDWLVKGRQAYRTVCVFDFGDTLVYGTDSELEPNAVIRLEKATGRIERLADLNGSCIYACRFGGLYALTTTVEPSQVNRSQHAALWLSRDGESWFRAYQAPKDRWNARYFQFGSLVLPRGASDREVILFSGQALVGVDGRVMVAKLSNDEEWEGG